MRVFTSCHLADVCILVLVPSPVVALFAEDVTRLGFEVVLVEEVVYAVLDFSSCFD